MACAAPLEPETLPDPPTVRFEVACDRPSVWWLTVDLVAVEGAGIWFLGRDAVLELPPVPGGERFDWSELDLGTGRTIQAGVAPLDSTGAVQVAVTCR